MKNDIEEYITRKCRCIRQKKPAVQPWKHLWGASHQTQPMNSSALSSSTWKPAVMNINLFWSSVIISPSLHKHTLWDIRQTNMLLTAFSKTFSGYPAKHHNQGRKFENYVFRVLGQLFSMHLSWMSPHHPPVNPVVRQNQTLFQILHVVGRKKRDNWKDHLPSFMYIHNCTKHESTSCKMLIYSSNVYSQCTSSIIVLAAQPIVYALQYLHLYFLSIQLTLVITPTYLPFTYPIHYNWTSCILYICPWLPFVTWCCICIVSIRQVKHFF